MFGYLISLVGVVILMCQKHVDVRIRYMALYFMKTGTYITLPVVWTNLVSNVSGHYKTEFASAMQIGLGSSGGIIASFVFGINQAPWFATGYFVSFGLLVLGACLMCGLVAGLRRENWKRIRGKENTECSCRRIQDSDLSIREILAFNRCSILQR